ncbi:hypothetical protein [Klenkia sp. PcliD-1-E]|uniref:hypothetical protein n=1 Tax=Klenkia sp. PcliD-1-E TaxID=2954492 RepID=UPI0020971352|nr:hypothetical protein [Klenkia sp. PcliD-1-E]MCO7218292.1 hypothetical protein [Klenkia sp. PcliD-1-E]
MSMEGLHAVPTPTVGGWIEERLRGFGSTVASNVPTGFGAYARVLHSVDLHAPPAASGNDAEDQGATVTWAQVCERTGRTPHALMQWRSITSPNPERDLSLSSEGLWDEVTVQEGTLQPAPLARLLDVLAPFTGDQECYHALWEGYGWLHGSSSLMVFTQADSRDGSPSLPPRRAEVPRQLQQALAAPRLSLPGRNYLLFAGPLRGALAMGHQVTDDWVIPQSPNLLWPADRSWCVSSEIDFDSTLVGGSAELIEVVLAAPGLEAWAVGEDDDLSLFADTLNR